MADSFKIVRERGSTSTLFRLYILDQKLPVATAYLRRSADGRTFVSREVNWTSIGYVDLETTVALVEGLAALILEVEDQ